MFCWDWSLGTTSSSNHFGAKNGNLEGLCLVLSYVIKRGLLLWVLSKSYVEEGCLFVCLQYATSQKAKYGWDISYSLLFSRSMGFSSNSAVRAFRDNLRVFLYSFSESFLYIDLSFWLLYPFPSLQKNFHISCRAGLLMTNAFRFYLRKSSFLLYGHFAGFKILSWHFCFVLFLLKIWIFLSTVLFTWCLMRSLI